MSRKLLLYHIILTDMLILHVSYYYLTLGEFIYLIILA